MVETTMHPSVLTNSSNAVGGYIHGDHLRRASTGSGDLNVSAVPHPHSGRDTAVIASGKDHKAAAMPHHHSHPYSRVEQFDVEQPDADEDDSPAPTKTAHTHVLGVRLDHWSPTAQFLILTGGVFAFFISYGYVQEALFRLEGFKFGWYLTFCQFVIYSLFALISLWSSGSSIQSRVPFRMYAAIGLFCVMTMGFSNAACQYLNYPTQVMFKSCKPIFVMLGSMFLLHKRFNKFQISSVLLLVTGVVIFSLADNALKVTFNVVGVLLSVGSLAGDVFASNYQERVLGQYDVSGPEMLLYQHGIGAGYVFLIMLGTNELVPAVTFCNENPQAYVIMTCFSLFGYFGVSCLVALMRLSGAVTVSVVTTCRKAATIMLSFVFFPKPFALAYLVGAFVLFVGLILNLYGGKPKECERAWQHIVNYFTRSARHARSQYDFTEANYLQSKV
eukprot:GFYU01002334.1.p1 GENE.GFYU01002334.1~~GFYU01002334.1.p1  ORF type:complete len:445 (-),score=90.51 GFYU01002334.1:991-2325(-)